MAGLFDDAYPGDATPDGGGGLLGRLFGGGGGSSTLDLYGDLFTDAQKKALQQREMTQGLFRMAEKLGALAQPSRAPPGLGGTLGALGAGLGALGGGTGEETAMKAMQTAEAVRKARSERAFQEKYLDPLMLAWLKKRAALGDAAAGPPPATSTTASAAPAPPVPEAPPVPPPEPGPYGVLGPPTAGVPTQNLSRWGLPARPLGPGAPPEALPVPGAPVQNTGLLGAPDQVVGPDGQPLTGQGVIPRMLASLTGGTPGDTLPFRLASAATPPPGAGAAGDDVLDRVIAPLESGNRNIHQQIVSPKVSTAQGYYQITNSTWRDTASKAGVDLDKYPTAMSAPREVQKQVAQKLLETRGLQPWADFNPRVAAATGYRRGGRFAGAGPDAGRIPIGGGDGDELQMLSALMKLTGRGGDSEEDPLATLASMTGGGAPDTVLRPGGGGDLPIQQATAALAPYAIGNARLGQPSSVAGVGANMSSAIERMVQAMPPNVRERFLITSGFRDAEQQARVNPRVTNSRHMHGGAVDLTKDPIVLDWITKNPQYGLGFPLASDPKEINHLEMIDPATGARAPLSGQDTVIPSGPRLQRGDIMNVADTGGGAAAPAGGSGEIPGLGISPEDLGMMNMLAKRSGLGEPFNSLLETYYKSPGYLAEKARTEEKARKGVALEMDPLIAKGVETAKARVDFEWKPKIQEAVEKLQSPILKERLEAKADIDRYSEELKQDKQASLTPTKATVYGPGGSVVTEDMTASEFANRQQKRAARIAKGDTTYQPGDIVGQPVGAAPAEHEYRMTPQGALTAVPVPGTPAAEKAAETANKKLQSEQQRLIGRDVVVNEVANIKDEMANATLPTTGLIGSWLQNTGDTAANNIRVARQTIEARMSTDAINAMRAASPTGAALGNASDQDLAVLRTAIANLDQSQGKAQFLQRLDRVQQLYIDAVHGPGASRLLPETPVLKTPASTAAPAGPIDQATFDKLPSGSVFIAPDGTRRIKP